MNFRKKGTFFLNSVVLCMLLLLPATGYAQDIKEPPDAKEAKEIDAMLFKPSAGTDRGSIYLQPGKFKAKIRSYAYWGANLSQYTRHGLFGSFYRVYPYVGMPPGPYGANIPHQTGRDPDRTANYNVLDVQSFNYVNTSANFTDWEAADLARTRAMGGVRYSNNLMQLASSNFGETWPFGYYGDMESFSGTGIWTDTPGERHWPGRWARDADAESANFGNEKFGQFASTIDVFFRSTDKYAGIRSADDIHTSYPVGLDLEHFVYSYSSPSFEDMIVWNIDLIFRTESSVRAQEADENNATVRHLYNGTIDGMYMGHTVDPRLPDRYEGPDASSGGTNPRRIDTQLMWDENFEALLIYHKYGHHAAQWGNLSRVGPVSVYTYMFTDTPDDLGMTSLHFYKGNTIYGLHEAGQKNERRMYGLMSGDPTLVPESEHEFWFHTYPEDDDYPNYMWDNLSSMRKWNDFTVTGEPLINKFDITTSSQRNTKPITFFTIATGPFSMSPGDTVPYDYILFGSNDNPGPLDPSEGLWPNNDPMVFDVDPTVRFGDVYINLQAATDLVANFLQGSGPPPTPTLSADGVLMLDDNDQPLYYSGDAQVTLFWDDEADQRTSDIVTRVNDFQGYRLWKRIFDPNNSTEWEIFEQWDISDGIEGWDEFGRDEFFASSPGFVGDLPNRLWMGTDTGIEHNIVDASVRNGLRYEYSLTAYDFPDAEQQLASQESPIGDTPKLKNYIRVMPGFKPLGYVVGSGDETTVHANGPGTGPVSLRIIDELAVVDADYTITFGTNDDGDKVYSVFNNTRGVFDLVESVVTSGEELADGDVAEDFFPVFNGVALSVVNEDELALKSSGWIVGGDNDWDLYSFSSSFSTPVSAVLEMRFFGGTYDPETGEYTDAPLGDFAFNSSGSGSFREDRPLPFQLWNVTDPANPFQYWIRQTGGSLGDLDFRNESTYFREKPFPDAPIGSGNGVARWRFFIDYDNDGKQPDPGDIYRWTTQHQFVDSDETFSDSYTFSTKANFIDSEEEKFYRIRVVPNPYVVSSALELYTQTSSFNKKEVRFINLPAECTIDIYTISGDRIKSIHHMSSLSENVDIRSSGGFLATDIARYPTGIGEARWDLLTEENLAISYGMYIYHVKTPDGRTFTGKMLVIK